MAWFQWHTPYSVMLAQACLSGGHTPVVIGSRGVPSAWMLNQRPVPDGVLLAPTIERANPDVLILQTAEDWHQAAISRHLMLDAGINPSAVRVMVLSHNRAEFESPEWVKSVVNAWGGVRLVCISEMKAQSWRDAGYANPIDVILPGIDTSEYGGWTGEGGYVLTVCNGLYRRLFDKEAWLEATRGLPVKLVGSGNEGIEGAVGPAESWEQLKSLYRCAAVYLNPTVPPNEDAWCLSLLEARATGTPWESLYEDAQGARTDLMRRLRIGAIPEWSGAVRRAVNEQFPLATFRQKWLDVLESVTA